MPTIEQLERMREAEPRDTFVLYALAQELAKKSRHEEAVASYRACLEVDPDYLYAYFHMARSLEADDREDEAIAALREGLRRAIDAGDEKARAEIGQYLDAIEP